MSNPKHPAPPRWFTGYIAFHGAMSILVSLLMFFLCLYTVIKYGGFGIMAMPMIFALIMFVTGILAARGAGTPRLDRDRITVHAIATLVFTIYVLASALDSYNIGMNWLIYALCVPGLFLPGYFAILPALYQKPNA